MEKEEAQRHTKTQGERQRDRDGTTGSTKELPSTQIHGMKGANSWGWRQGARVLVIKQFNRDLFPRLVSMKQLKKVLHRSSCLRLCGDKGSPGPQRLRGGNGTAGFPDTSGRQLKGRGIQDREEAAGDGPGP